MWVLLSGCESVVPGTISGCLGCAQEEKPVPMCRQETSGFWGLKLILRKEVMSPRNAKALKDKGSDSMCRSAWHLATSLSTYQCSLDQNMTNFMLNYLLRRSGHIFIQLLIPQIFTHTHPVPSTVLGTGKTAEANTDKCPCQHEAYIQAVKISMDHLSVRTA